MSRKAGTDDFPGVSVGVWQRAQPMSLKSFLPRTMLSLSGAGVGAANIRIKTANFTTSLGTFRGRFSPKFVGLSGVLLYRQPGASSRSCGKRSLVAPCSTL